VRYEYCAASFGCLDYVVEQNKFRAYIQDGWEPFLMSACGEYYVNVIFRKYIG
jgi:hypothetical protein